MLHTQLFPHISVIIYTSLLTSITPNSRERYTNCTKHWSLGSWRWRRWRNREFLGFTRWGVGHFNPLCNILAIYIINKRQEEEEDLLAERHLRRLRVAKKKVRICLNDNIQCFYNKHIINNLVNFSINFNYVLSETRGAAAGKPPGKSAGKASLAKTPGKLPFSL